LNRCRACHQASEGLIPCEGNSYLCEPCAAAALDLLPPDAEQRSSAPAADPIRPFEDPAVDR